MNHRFEKRTDKGWLLFIVLGTTAVFIVDTQTMVGVATWLFYLVPMGACFFVLRPTLPFLVAAASTLLIGVDYIVSPEGIAEWVAQLNRFFGLIVIWAFSFQTSQVVTARLKLNERDWLRTGQSALAERVIGEHSLQEISTRIVAFIAEYLDARVGALYVRESTERAALAAGFALPPEHLARQHVALGEGIVGQSFVDGKVLELRQLPADYLKVGSGLGDTQPSAVLIAPVTADKEVIGILELGFLAPIYDVDVELLRLLAEPAGVALRTARLRNDREQLLQETQRQAEELQSQQEELRVSNEELEQQSNMLRESQVRLETQQAELEQINSQLEEHAQMLARQNDELDLARNDLLIKAAELERSNQFKSEFLANMSHELRTPLNSSLILAKLLGDNVTGNLTDEQVKFARNIYSAGNDLLDLINDILDLSKIEARKVELRREPVSIAQLVDSLTQTFTPVASQKQVALESSMDVPGSALMHTDSQRLRQILKNLLSNALKFTAHGRVALHVSLPKRSDLPADWIAFAVSDTGIGISPEQHEIIFEPFRQADGTTNRRFGGTGLGLSISRELATMLGGRIELQSTPGRGSVFTLLLPQRMPELRQDEASPDRSTGARSVASALRSVAANSLRSVRQASRPVLPADNIVTPAQPASERLLLVIEDDAGFANTLCELSRSLHYDCMIALTADEGVELALRHHPTAIVLDIHLPDHTGLTVLDRLKHNPQTRHIPVQVISGFDHTQAALEMGAASVMMKPVDRERLIEALSGLERKLDHGERSVLIVEDNSLQRDSIQQLLQSERVRAVAVASAAAALDQLRSATFDCMVLDLALPDASGFELLERMAGDDAYSFPPVIVYTGRSLSADEEQQLRRYSRSIIIKGAKSPERLLDEVTLFLHQVEAALSADQQRMLRVARSRDAVFEGRRILLVEDDVRNVFAISRVLEPHGATLEIARNGREALTALARVKDIELVLMDIMMPEMDGMEAMREIRKTPGIAKVPIVALTAKAMPDDRQRCLDAGADDYITKPIDIEKLLSLLRIWLPPRKGMAR